MTHSIKYMGLLLVALLLFPGHLLAKPRYSQAQIQAMIAREKAKQAQNASAKDKILNALKAEQLKLEQRLAGGVCQRISLPKITKQCHRACTFSVPVFRDQRKCLIALPTRICLRHKKIFNKNICVKSRPGPPRCIKHGTIKVPAGSRCIKHGEKCKLVTTKQHIQLCVRRTGNAINLFVNGRAVKVDPALKKAAEAAMRGFKALELTVKKELEKLAHQIKYRTEQVASLAKKKFDKAVADFRVKAKAVAEQLSRTPVWQKVVLKVFMGALTRKLLDVAKMSLGKTRTELLKLLRTQKDFKAIRSLMMAKKAGAAALKSHGKTALIAIAIVVTAETARVVVVCWPHSGNAKRSCLNRELATAVRNLTFDTVVAMTRLALDIVALDPISHALASAVTAKLAALSAGVGTVGYPICYGVSSVVINLVVLGLVEGAVRPLYNLAFDKVARGLLTTMISQLTPQIPEELLKCWGPKALCK